MNYYIDFDNTLYNTPLLTEKMLKSIAESICKQNQFDYKEIFKEAKSMFNRENIYNIYKLAEYFSNKYNVSLSSIVNNLNLTILDGKNFVFDDSIKFLKHLKENGHNVFLLSYCKESLEYQSLKIVGSGLTDFFDALYITANPKYTLDIDYSTGIFIDDNPSDLIGLYSKKCQKVIRIRRKENKYSVKDIANSDIVEFENFNEII